MAIGSRGSRSCQPRPGQARPGTPLDPQPQQYPPVAVVGAAASSARRRSSPFSLCSAELMAVRVASLPSYDFTLQGRRGRSEVLAAVGGGGWAAAVQGALQRAAVAAAARCRRHQRSRSVAKCSQARTWRPAPCGAAPPRLPPSAESVVDAPLDGRTANSGSGDGAPGTV